MFLQFFEWDIDALIQFYKVLIWSSMRFRTNRLYVASHFLVIILPTWQLSSQGILMMR